MYPSKFRYEAPTSLEEALGLLKTYGSEAKVLAGGQSLIPMVKLRFATPQVLMDINGLPNLSRWYDTVASRPAVQRAISCVEALVPAA